MRGRIIIAEICPWRRAGIRTILSSDPDLEVVGETGAARSVLALTQTLVPDALLLDGRMGLERVEQIHAAGLGTALLVWTDSDDLQSALFFRAAGALECLSRQEAPEQVVRTIKQAIFTVTGSWPEGRAALPPAQDCRDPLAQFSGRERQVLALLRQGARNKDIAVSLNITERTVEYHLGNIMRTLGVCSRVQVLAVLGKEPPGHEEPGFAMQPEMLAA